MPTFIGYSTINATSKVTLTDTDLIIQDLLNALNIQQGQLPGKPEIGCPIWSYLFEQQTPATVAAMKNIMQKTCQQDARLQVVSINLFQQDNGVLFEMEVAINTDVNPRQLSIFFNSQTQAASLISGQS